MKINKEWHLAHPMPKNPTHQQRIEWHIEHAKYCQCRKMPEKLKAEIDKISIKPESEKLKKHYDSLP